MDSEVDGLLRLILGILRLEKASVALVLISVALLGWQHWGMNANLILTPDQNLRLVVKNDHSDGGKSVCSVETLPDRWTVHYDIRPGVSWAFCGMNLARGGRDSMVGFDLTGFDTTYIELSEFTGTNKSLQMTLKAMDSSIYRPDDNVSLKYLTLEFAPNPAPGKILHTSLPIEFFSIPSWWISRFKVPIANLNRDRHQVREVEFITASGQAVFGSGTVSIHRIEFHGKWVRQDTLLRVILGAIFLYVFSLLGIKLVKSVGTERKLRLRAGNLQDLANKDPLTGALNRRGLDTALADLRLRSSLCKEATLGVMMLDLDHFKTVNDTFGHEAGDVVLRQLAAIVQVHLRDNNIFTRWGGEEFLLAIANIPAERLRQVAEKIRSHIETSLRYQEHTVTVSIGLAHGRLEAFPTLTNLADQALYRAKGNGRNQVMESEA